MVKVEVTIQEAKAVRELAMDAKVPVHLVYILGGFLLKLEKAFAKEQEKELKKRFSLEDKKE